MSNIRTWELRILCEILISHVFALVRAPAILIDRRIMSNSMPYKYHSSRKKKDKEAHKRQLELINKHAVRIFKSQQLYIFNPPQKLEGILAIFYLSKTYTAPKHDLTFIYTYVWVCLVCIFPPSQK